MSRFESRLKAGRPGPAAVVLGLALALALAFAPLPVSADGDPFAKDAVDAAIDHAIDYLVGIQYRTGRHTGAIHDGSSNLVAMTSLAVMAMASVGHQPVDDTPEGAAMRAGLAFVLLPENQDRRGYFGGRDGSRMYGHGIITLMLAEMIGMGLDDEQDRIIRERVENAVALILASQRLRKGRNEQGGWRYTPDARDSDLSVTVWQVMALRSAKNSGLEIPASAIDAAVGYIRRCYRPGHGRRGADGNRVSAFGYQPGGGLSYSTAAAGLLSMQVCGQYDAPEVISASDWLLAEELNYNDYWFFYGTYYYAQGLYQRGGEHAKQSRRRVEEMLLRHQANDGSWHAGGSSQERSAGRSYCTAMAVLSLSVKFHYLPIYQR